MEPTGLDLDVDRILHYIRMASETIGIKWLFTKIKEEEKRRNKDKVNVKSCKHSYLYRSKPHPLVEWAMDVERWRKACLETGKLELKESILKFAVLGKALEKAGKRKGFHKLISRLKQKSEFYAAAFEAEVAASYVERDWEVEFIEESQDRSPDLKVTRNDGGVFWVECKCRDMHTERDKSIQSFWTELESTLLREIGPNKSNVAILLKSLDDPCRSEIVPLKEFLLDAVHKGGIRYINVNTGELRCGCDPTGKYQIIVQKLEKDELSGLAYRPLIMTLEHENPRHVVSGKS